MLGRRATWDSCEKLRGRLGGTSASRHGRAPNPPLLFRVLRTFGEPEFAEDALHMLTARFDPAGVPGALTDYVRFAFL